MSKSSLIGLSHTNEQIKYTIYNKKMISLYTMNTETYLTPCMRSSTKVSIIK